MKIAEHFGNLVTLAIYTSLYIFLLISKVHSQTQITYLLANYIGKVNNTLEIDNLDFGYIGKYSCYL